MSCIWFNPYPLTIKFFDIPYPYIFPLIMSRRNSDIAPKPGVITSPFTLPSNKLKKTKYLENMHSSSIIFFFLFFCFMAYQILCISWSCGWFWPSWNGKKADYLENCWDSSYRLHCSHIYSCVFMSGASNGVIPRSCQIENDKIF